MRRRLAAVLAADIAGYTRLIGTDQDGTLRALFAFKQDVLRPLADQHNGSIVKDMGDGWLIVFQSALEATICALSIQDALSEDALLSLRIGLTLGDVIEQDHDVFGDGVNVAARLQTVAPIGGLALTQSVFDTLDAKTAQRFTNAGVHHLRNVVRPVQVLLSDASAAHVSSTPEPRTYEPGIVSLVLVQPSRVARDDKAYGLAVDINADLLRLLQTSDLVAPRIAGAQAPRDYGVSIEVRGRDEQMRLHLTLSDQSHETIWKRTIAPSSQDTATSQDHIASDMAASLFGAIIDAESSRLFGSIEPEDPNDCILRSAIEFSEFSNAAMAEAAQRLAELLEGQRLESVRPREVLRFLLSADIAGVPVSRRSYAQVFISAKNSGADQALIALATAMTDFTAQPAAEVLDRAIELALQRAPLDPDVLVFSGWACVWLGTTGQALRCFNDFARKGSFHSLNKLATLGASFALLQAGRDEEALDRVRRVLAATSELAAPFVLRAAALSNRGDLASARAALAQIKRLPAGEAAKAQMLSRFQTSPAGIRLCESLDRIDLQGCSRA
ncbi:MAG: adenylate/guanylate cyclase domain-containing protein [Paracoccaceae bacterium]